MSTGPVRVLHIITRLVVGGAQENTLLTVARLDRARYDVTLASGPATGPEGSLEERIPDDIQFVRIPELIRQLHPIKDAVALARLVALMRRGRFHIVHTHTTKAGLVGRIAARLAGVPIVIHTPHGHAFHDYLSRGWSEALKVVERWLARWTNAIICLTPGERDDHLRFGVAPADKFEIIHSGVDLSRYAGAKVEAETKRRELNLPSSGPLVGCVARLVPVKGVQYLLEAAPMIRALVPEATVVFVGDGPLRPEMERRAADLSLNGGVAFLGLRDDVADLMPLFAVVVLPSLNEGMGRAAVEAMAAGRPVVGTRVSGIQDVIAHEVSGLLVPPADAREIAGAVARLLREPALGIRLTTTARAELHQYSVEAMMGRIERLYASLARARWGRADPHS